MTFPVGIEGINTAEDFLAYTARVSNPDNQINTATAPKLLRYLVRKNHWSPFEMVSLTLKIETTRDIGRQVLRHRSFSFQEFSQRYAISTKFVFREARLQDTENRQNSLETNDEELQSTWRAYQARVLDAAKQAYDWALRNGIAKEQFGLSLKYTAPYELHFNARMRRAFLGGDEKVRKEGDSVSLFFIIISTMFY